MEMAARARHRQLVLTMASNGGFKDSDEKEMACIMPPLHVAVCLGKVADVKELVKQCAAVDVSLLIEVAGHSHAPAQDTMRAFLAGMPPTQWRSMLNGPLSDVKQAAVLRNIPGIYRPSTRSVAQHRVVEECVIGAVRPSLASHPRTSPAAAVACAADPPPTHGATGTAVRGCCADD